MTRRRQQERGQAPPSPVPDAGAPDAAPDAAPRRFASSPCMMDEVDPAYMGLAPREPPPSRRRKKAAAGGATGGLPADRRKE